MATHAGITVVPVSDAHEPDDLLKPELTHTTTGAGLTDEDAHAHL